MAMKKLLCIVFCIVIQIFTGCAFECSKLYMMLKETSDADNVKTITPMALDEIQRYQLMAPYNSSKIFDTLVGNKGCVLNIKCENPILKSNCTKNVIPSDTDLIPSGSTIGVKESSNEDKEIVKTAVVAVAAVAGVGAITYFVAKKIIEMMQYGAYHLPAETGV